MEIEKNNIALVEVSSLSKNASMLLKAISHKHRVVQLTHRI